MRGKWKKLIKQGLAVSLALAMCMTTGQFTVLADADETVGGIEAGSEAPAPDASMLENNVKVVSGNPADEGAPGEGTPDSDTKKGDNNESQEHAHGNWGEGEITKEATCTETGVRTFKCHEEGCEETKTEEIPVADHKDENGDETCDICGASLTKADPEADPETNSETDSKAVQSFVRAVEALKNWEAEEDASEEDMEKALADYKSSYESAKTLYSALTDEQKLLEEVQKAYEELTAIGESLELMTLENGECNGGENCTHVAAIGSKHYDTLQEAINAAKSDMTVTLYKNTNENIVIGEGQKLTLDLNGCILDGGTVAGKAALLNKGIVTIMDGKGGGTIKREDDGAPGYYTVRNDYKMYIRSGIITNNSNKSNLLINYNNQNSGNFGGVEGVYMEISGGTISQTSMSALKNDPGCTMHITGDATVIERNSSNVGDWACNFYGKVIIDGGTITTSGIIPFMSHKNANGSEFAGEFTVTGNARLNCYGVYLVNGMSGGKTDAVPKLTISGDANINATQVYQAVNNNGLKLTNDKVANIDIDGGIFYGGCVNDTTKSYIVPGMGMDGNGKVVVLTTETSVAETGGICYASVQKAIEAANEGETVTLLRDVTEDVTVSGTVTLDLNGKILMGAGSKAATVINNGTLTITDSSNATDENSMGTIVGVNSTGPKSAIINNADATCTIAGGRITRKPYLDSESQDNTGTNSNYTVQNKGGMYITGGLIVNNSSKSSMVVNLNNQGGGIYGKASNVKMVISGGTLRQDTYTALKNDPNSTMEITGGANIVNGEANSYVTQFYGNVTITGGNFSGGQLWACSHADAEGNYPTNVNITGGSMNVSEIRVIYGYVMNKDLLDGSEKVTVNISGNANITCPSLYEMEYDQSSKECQEISDNTKSEIAISGGTFSHPVSTEHCAEGYVPVSNADGTYGVSNSSSGTTGGNTSGSGTTTGGSTSGSGTTTGGGTTSGGTSGSGTSAPAAGTPAAVAPVSAAAPTPTPAAITPEAEEEEPAVAENVELNDEETPLAAGEDAEEAEEETATLEDEKVPLAAKKSNHWWLFSIISILLATGGIFFIIFWKRRKKEEEEAKSLEL